MRSALTCDKTTAMSEIAEWTALARQILKTGHDIFATANVPITAKGYNDEKFRAMALLARTMSNFRGALLLLEHRRVIEGRVITRCCLENSYWIAGLVAEGEKFTREMLHDEIGHRQIRGQRLFASGLPLGDKVEERLRAWLKNSSKRFKNAKTLTPKTVALKTAIGKSYIFYEQLSSDAAHPSLDALNRHVIPHTPNEVGGIDVEPAPRDEEIRAARPALPCSHTWRDVAQEQAASRAPRAKCTTCEIDRFRAFLFSAVREV